jgi:hypothetical protein
MGRADRSDSADRYFSAKGLQQTEWFEHPKR